MKVLLGSLYSNFFAFNENVNLQGFFPITMIKKIKEQIKISVCTINTILPLLWEVVIGLNCSIVT